MSDQMNMEEQIIGGESQEDKLLRKGTPGPWQVETTTDHGAAYRVMDEQEVTIALCYQQPHDTWQASDNARIIATAPDALQFVRDELEALKVWQLDLLQSSRPHNDVLDGIEISMDKARSILARVEGDK